MIIVNDTKEAAEIIKGSRRLLVMGCSGNGKSTLSNQLSERLGLPHISCDRDIFWLPGWKLRPRPEIVERMTAFAAEDRWIIDGNSPARCLFACRGRRRSSGCAFLAGCR